VRSALLLASIALAAAACEAPKPPESKLVIQAVEALRDGRLSTEDRERRLAELRALPLRDPQAARVRDACVTLHEAIIEADGLTREARERVDAYESVPAAEREAKEGAEIADLIGRSHQALRRSEDARDACLRGVLSLERGEGR
jgi:hypothetical protein